MEIDTDSHGAQHLQDTAKATCWTSSFVLSALAVTLVRFGTNPSIIIEIVGNRGNLFLLYIAMVGILTILLYFVMRLIGKKSPYWFLWDGPIADVHLEEDQDLSEISDWIEECLPNRAYFIFTARKRLTIKFKYDTDFLFFRTAW